MILYEMVNGITIRWTLNIIDCYLDVTKGHQQQTMKCTTRMSWDVSSLTGHVSWRRQLFVTSRKSTHCFAPIQCQSFGAASPTLSWIRKWGRSSKYLPTTTPSPWTDTPILRVSTGSASVNWPTFTGPRPSRKPGPFSFSVCKRRLNFEIEFFFINLNLVIAFGNLAT